MHIKKRTDKELQEVLLFGTRYEPVNLRKYTMQFCSFSEQIRDKWLSLAHLEDGELPIFGSYRNESHWLLCTTRHFVWSDCLSDSQILRYSYRDIRLVADVGGYSDKRYGTGFSFHVVQNCFVPGAAPANYRELLPPPYNQIMHPQVLNPWLLLETVDGRRYEIFIEIGAVIGGSFVFIHSLMTQNHTYENQRNKMLNASK